MIQDTEHDLQVRIRELEERVGSWSVRALTAEQRIAKAKAILQHGYRDMSLWDQIDRALATLEGE